MTTRDEMVEALTEVLERYAIFALDEQEALISDLADVADQWWTDEQVAAHVGSIRLDGVRWWCRRHGVVRQRMSNAAQVRRAKAAMPGMGKRSDLRSQ